MNKLKFTPLGGRLLIKKIEKEEHMGGLIIPDALGVPTYEAEILIIGLGGEPKYELKEGDRVMLPMNSGTTVKLGKAVYNLVDEKEILAIL